MRNRAIHTETNKIRSIQRHREKDQKVGEVGVKGITERNREKKTKIIRLRARARQRAGESWRGTDKRRRETHTEKCKPEGQRGGEKCA